MHCRKRIKTPDTCMPAAILAGCSGLELRSELGGAWDHETNFQCVASPQAERWRRGEGRLGRALLRPCLRFRRHAAIAFPAASFDTARRSADLLVADGRLVGGRQGRLTTERTARAFPFLPSPPYVGA